MQARTSRRRLHLAVAIVLTCVACGPVVAPTQSPTPSATVIPSASVVPSVDQPTLAPTASPSPTASHDRAMDPFTVLVLGRDQEGRTDTIVVVGVDPASKSMSLASIPRDTIDVPLPGGGTFKNRKINAFYNMASGDRKRYPQGPARATADMVGGMLGIRIDFTASTTFSGFSRLVDAMGGVRITLPKAIVDPHYEVTTTDVGVRFPKGPQKLNGKRALIYVRTRYADNDFERQRRQQAFLLAAGRQLLSNPKLLVALTGAESSLTTDFPIDRLPVLIAAIRSIDGWTIRQVVLGPKKYESSASCTCGYALTPKLDEMREVAARFFPWAVGR